MHKQLSAGTGLGSLLRKTLGASGLGTLAKVRPPATTVQRPAAGASALSAAKITAEDISTAKAVASNAIQQREGMFGPMFAATRAACAEALAKAATPQPVSTAGKMPRAADASKVPTMKQPGGDFGVALDIDNPQHVHAKMLRESAAEHERLLASFRAVYAGPAVNPATGPRAI